MATFLRFWTLILVCCNLSVLEASGCSSNSNSNSSSHSSRPLPSPSILPPTHVRGHQLENKFVSQSDLINVIRWFPPKTGNTPVAYKIFRDSHLTQLLATIPANKKLEFADHNRKEHRTYRYFLVSVDSQGKLSNPIGIIFNGSKTRVVKIKTLLSIEVTPFNPSIGIGFEEQFTATGIFSNGSAKDLTDQVKWSSSNPSVATISSTGLATSLQAGQTTIVACINGVKGSTTLTVTSATLVEIEVTPIDPSLAIGFTEQFTAIGIFSDNTKEVLTDQVVWTSTNPGVASISGTGLATAIAAGTTQMHATHGSITGSTTLTVTKAHLVSIGVTPVNPSVAVGFTEQFTAIGTFDDGTTEDLTNQIAWTSSNSAVASISANGLATAISQGTTTVTASVESISGSTTLTVTPALLIAIEVSPVNASVAAGFTQQFQAVGIFSDLSKEDITKQVTWSSSDTTIAEISNASGSQGLALGLRVGTVQIQALFDGVANSVPFNVTNALLQSIDISPVNPSTAAGYFVQFSAEGLFSDGTKKDLTASVTWTSSKEAVAKISNDPKSEGLAKALTVGTTTITATQGGISNSTALTVTNAVLLSINVNPPNGEVIVGHSLPFTATGVFSDQTTPDLTNSVTWKSSNTTIASISNAAGSQGLATGIQADSTPITITATLNGVSGSASLTVTAATLTFIEIAPIDAKVAKGLSIQFSAIGHYNNGTTQPLTDTVTWLSSTETVAEISGTSLAAALAVGETTITAALNGVSNSTSLTVTDATLQTIQVTPFGETIAEKFTLQYTATGIFSDGSTQDITDQATWDSSNQSAATISNTPGSVGLTQANSPGDTTISASFERLDGRIITGDATLTVTNAVVVSIQVEPIDDIVPAELTIQYNATGIFDDGSSQNITRDVAWTSSNIAAAVISDAAGNKGEATTLAKGNTTISATALNGVSGSTNLQVTSAIPVSIQVTPPNPAIFVGFFQEFTAMGTYDDGSMADLTKEVVWSSSDPEEVASISNKPGTEGEAEGLGPGVATMTAQFGTVKGTTELFVSSASLVSIAIEAIDFEENPIPPTVPAGLSMQFQATGIYEDGTSRIITEDVTWKSSSPTIANISNAAGSEGKAQGLTPGSTDITATASGILSNSVTLEVSSGILTAITIEPINPSEPEGVEIQFFATGTFFGSPSRDITTEVTWTSNNTAIATISNLPGEEGLAIGKSPGSATIKAELDGISDATTFTVTNADLLSITVTPTNATLTAGVATQYKATGSYNNGQNLDITDQATWVSLNTTIAVVDNALSRKGVVTGQQSGSTQIVAAFMGKTGQTDVTIACPAITFTTGTVLPNATFGQFYFTTLKTNAPQGLNQTFTVTSGALPTGLSLETNSGNILGTPTVTRGNRFTVQAKTSCGSVTSKEFTIAIDL